MTMCTWLEFDFFVCRISTVQAEWKINSISMRWCCKICRFSTPNQRTLITHCKLKHCHQIAGPAVVHARDYFKIHEDMRVTVKDDVINGVVIGILVVVENVMDPLPAFYNDVDQMIEEEVIICHLSDVPNAFLNLMGLVYALNLDYPKELKFTFEVIQCLFFATQEFIL